MNKEEKLSITKSKLIESTTRLMEELDDPMMVTSREIAREAGVKAAMINYCFGSRENLIYQVFQNQYMDFLKSSDVRSILSSGASDKEILKELHFIVARCLIENPKLTKAVTGFVLFKRDLSQVSFSYPYVCRHYAGAKSEEECRLIAYELSSALQLMIFRMEDLKKDFGIDLSDPEVLRHYIGMRIDLLLNDVV
ncbi:MAG: TetR family transcriptional regulator [Lachnospiraceae bacterium]|nr:TetR family transcriptional regulator [Lachnospiraceae bacterium]